MAVRNKTIITCAITGSVHTPSMSPYLPVTPEEIIEASVGAAGRWCTWRLEVEIAPAPNCYAMTR